MQRDIDPDQTSWLGTQVRRLAESLEKASIAEYLELYRNPYRLWSISFVSGIVRGFGMAVGFTLVSALFLLILAKLAALQLPLIGEYIAVIARIVQAELRVRPH